MSISGTIITGNVSQRDVQTALSVGSNVNKWSQLCTHDNVRLWAKYKPISYNSITTPSVDQRRSVNYGIKNIPVWSGSGSVNKMGYFWFGINTSNTNAPQCGNYDIGNYWGWLKPTGGSASPYRIKDFLNYKYDAQAPIGGVKNSSIKITAKGQMVIEFNGNGVGQTDGYTVPLSELSAGVTFGNLYMSVMIRKKNTNTFYVASYENKWSEDQSTTVQRFIPSASVGDALKGDCEVFPFLSSVKYTTYESDLGQADGTVVAMYQKSDVNVWIEKAKADISDFSAYYTNPSHRVLNSRFSLTNNSCVGGFTASYTIRFMTSSETYEVTASGSVWVGYGETVLVTPQVAPQWNASVYNNGYAVVTVRASSSSAMFTEETSKQTRIYYDSGPTPDINN